MIVRLTVAIVAAPLSCSLARAQQVDRPTIHSGDVWTYQDTYERNGTWRQTHNRLVVVHAGPSSIAVESQQVDSPQPPKAFMVGADWDRVRDVNGRQTIVNQPLAFPLTHGKTWTNTYTEDHPNRAHAREQFKTTYQTVGWEDIQVPAGTFHAIKIEADGEWTADIAPALVGATSSRVDTQGSSVAGGTRRIAAQTASGRTYKAFWYVPGVKRWVKSIEEFYDSGGNLTERYTGELEDYKVAN